VKNSDSISLISYANVFKLCSRFNQYSFATSFIWCNFCFLFLSERHTEPCQAGWLHFQSKCYLICSRDSPDQKTWQAAQDDCREKDADLVAIQSPAEQVSGSGPRRICLAPR
uniref:C-type lectin domain-containing protein n=1 Tax=Acanthochromis polyacanthus TaxID=80966 RepID=A0A3Q1FXW3_9TELE